METSSSRPTPTAARAEPGELPLCVDLDGTLIRTDMLLETIADGVRRRPLAALAVPFWLASGRARLKSEVAARADVDVSVLPYREELVGYLREQRARGRTVVLATASDERVGRAIADHLGVFDDVMASDGRRNLRGAAKAAALVERFGERGFVYAGNDAHDVPVWERAGGAILVDVPSAVARRVPGALPVERRLDRASGRARALLRALRPHQWTKNLLVFLPPIPSGAILEPDVFRSASLMFVAFCLLASGVYVFNDVLDLSADRRHPRKRRRPFASGDLPLTWAGIGPLAFALGLVLAFTVSPWCGVMLLLYSGLTTGYSLVLKRHPLVDVFTLAALYSLRIIGGGVASGYFPTPWLLALSSFVFLSLALLKRSSELRDLMAREGRRVAGRGYRVDDLPLLNTMGVASAFVSALVLTLYVDSEMARKHFAQPRIMWGTAPLVLFWQCRLWLAVTRGKMHDDPVVFALRDRVSWLTLAALLVVFLLARMGLPGVP